MFSIGQVSKQTGIKIPTSRYYEEIGLVDIKQRSTGNQRRYSFDNVKRLSFVKHARELGFSIESIHRLLALTASKLDSCSDIDQLVTVQLGEVKSKISQLKKLESELSRMLEGCKTQELGQCYVVESLANHELCQNSH